MKIIHFLLKVLLGTTGAVVLLAGIFAVGNFAMVPPRMTANNLHLAWLTEGKDYFVPRGTGTVMELNPELLRLDNGNESFSREKEPGVFRIFCVGGSTTRGWPFHKVLSYPGLLSLYFRDVLPRRKIEVINAGLHASDSASDVQLVREILRYHPDLILLYEGRNEAWNLPIHSPAVTNAVKVHVFLSRRVYLYEWLQNRLLKDFDHAQTVRDYAERNYVFDEGALRASVTGNLSVIAGLTGGNNVRLVLLTQVLHSTERNRNTNIAKINAWTKEFARSRDIPLIDVDEAFRTSPVPEEELVIPFCVHPDYRGYALMSRTVCKGLAANGMIAPAREWRWSAQHGDDYYFKQLGLTPEFLCATYSQVMAGKFKQLDLKGFERRYRALARRYAKEKM